MSAIKLCRICLRSDNIIARAIDERLLDFYDEISDINVIANPMLTFCPLCEYKLRKFYNFKQKCLRSNYILKRKIADLEHMDLGSLMQLAPRDSVGFSMPSDRSGFFDYKCNDDLFIILNSTLTENYQTTQSKTERDEVTSEFDPLKDEVMIDTDLIKSEVEKILEDPITINKDKLIENMEEDKCMEINEFKAETIVEDDTNEIHIIKSDDDDDDIELKKENLSDYDNPLSKKINTDDPLDTDFDNEELPNDDEKISKPENKKKPIKEASFKTDLNSIKTKTIKSKKTSFKKVKQTKKKKKITMKQLELLQREPFDLNDFSLDELKCVKELLPASEKKYVNLRLKVEDFKNGVVDLLEQGKIDLGEVKITKEVFLEMAAKCSIKNFKAIGIAKQGLTIPKVKKFLLSLRRRFNPDYETVYKIEYLNTREKKLAEFESRKHSEEYIKATFKCEICFLPFPYKAKLEYHKKWHDPNRAHACDICPMRFAELSAMRSHRKSHYTAYRCKLCPVSTYYVEAMVNHYNQHKGRLYTCDICLNQYESQSTLNCHRLSHTRFTCELCARKYHSQRTLDKHMKLKHANEKAGADEATLSCDQCDAVFKTDLHRRRHMRKHEGLFYKCLFSSCNERFSSASELREHARSSGHVRRPTETLANGEPYQKDKESRICPVCGDQVVNNSAASLYMHHQRHHPFEPYKLDSGYTVLCEHCGKAFMNHAFYIDHLNTHTGVKPYECKECGARFSKRLLLNIHSATHGARRHECEDCGKKFNSAANLYTHRRAHIGDRKFKCTVCDKGFLHPGSLREHIRGVHNGIRRDKRRGRKQTDK